jgi:hypothetical protein
VVAEIVATESLGGTHLFLSVWLGEAIRLALPCCKSSQ